MAAVVRVKRALDEEPSEAFLLNCKRRKIDCNPENDLPELSKLAEFAGTTKSQDDDIHRYLKKSIKTPLAEQFKKRNIDISAKLRNQKQENSKDNRFKIIKSFRTLKSNGEQSEENNSDLIIYDIETENASKGQEDNCVFDLYFAENFNGSEETHEISVHALSEELIQGSLGDNGFNDSDSADSQDSNAENFWTHDYPDESDAESIDEDDMIQAVNRLDLGDDLSSDEEEDGNFSNTQRNSLLYEKYKARNKQLEETETRDSDLNYGDSDDEDDF